MMGRNLRLLTQKWEGATAGSKYGHVLHRAVLPGVHALAVQPAVRGINHHPLIALGAHFSVSFQQVSRPKKLQQLHDQGKDCYDNYERQAQHLQKSRQI